MTSKAREGGVARFVSPCPSPEGFERELLTILIEECAEVIQRATKALRFGLDEVQPGQAWTNNCRLSQEIGDVYATINLAVAHKLVSPGCIADGMAAKERKLGIFMQTTPPPPRQEPPRAEAGERAADAE